MKMTGSCLCGAVQYESSAAPVVAGNCHCKDCQKASGSAYAPTLFVPENTLSIRGEVRFFESRGDSGGMVQRGFCPQCGSQLFGKTETLPGLIAIRAGTLDDTSLYQPHVDLYVGSAARWDHIAPGAVTFEKMPPPPAA